MRGLPVGAPVTRLLVALALLGCGGAELQLQGTEAPVRPAVLFTIADESACWGATAWSGSTRTDLGWGDHYHEEGNRLVVTYRGETVVVCPPRRRTRRAR